MSIDKEQTNIPKRPKKRDRQDPVADIFHRSPSPRVEFIQSPQFHRGPIRNPKMRQLIAWSWFAAAVDFLTVIGLSFLFIYVASVFMRVEVVQLFLFLESSPVLLVAFVCLVFSAMYLILSRCFLGFSLGEWTCDLRMGSEAQLSSPSYILRVIFRFLVLSLTGFAILPILSWVLATDIAGKISGVSVTAAKN